MGLAASSVRLNAINSRINSLTTDIGLINTVRLRYTMQKQILADEYYKALSNKVTGYVDQRGINQALTYSNLVRQLNVGGTLTKYRIVDKIGTEIHMINNDDPNLSQLNFSANLSYTVNNSGEQPFSDSANDIKVKGTDLAEIIKNPNDNYTLYRFKKGSSNWKYQINNSNEPTGYTFYSSDTITNVVITSIGCLQCNNEPAELLVALENDPDLYRVNDEGELYISDSDVDNSNYLIKKINSGDYIIEEFNSVSNCWVPMSLTDIGHGSLNTSDDTLAEQKYKNEMAKVTDIETRLDNEKNRCETEKKALETEMESVQGAIKANIERMTAWTG